MTASPLQYASPGRRLLAMLTDVLLLWFLLAFARFLPVLLEPGILLETPIPAEPWLFTPFDLLLLFLLAMLITALFWQRLAGTPGKLLLGVRVVSASNGRAPGFGQSILRFLGYLVSLLPAALGLLWMFRDRRRQGFHDKIGGTLVILDDEATKPLAQLLDEVH